MGSLRFGGVVFQIFSDDHLPRHVHGRYAGVEVIIVIEGTKALQAERKDALRPPNAKKSDVAHILASAQRAILELNRLWEDIYGA